MKKILLITIFLISNIFANAFDMPEVRAKILETNNSQAKIPNSLNLKVGSSGVVIHTFKNGDKSIVARVVVDKIGSNFTTLKFEVFNMLEQSALPLPNIVPQVGDEVILNFLYNRSLIVAPNKEVYNQIVNAFPNITFINPDIAAAYLNFNNKPNPNRDDFRKICNQNTAGLIFFALDNKGFFVDCGDFNIIQSFDTGKINYYEVPFYSRIKDIKAAFYDFSNEQIKNYNEYYKKLLNDWFF